MAAPVAPHLAAPLTEQETHDATRIATARRFVAHVRYMSAPQTQEAAGWYEAGLYALAMHDTCAALNRDATGLPMLYAMPLDGGPGVLVPTYAWLPQTLDRLAQAGGYTPRPEIAREAALCLTRPRRGF